MPYENSSAASLVNLETGALLDALEYKIKAGNDLEDGGANGLVRTIGYVSEKDSIEDIGPYAPGVDLPQDLAIPQTFANKEALAYKGRGQEGPHKLYLLVEQGDRYKASTGPVGIQGLARLSVALTAIGAKESGARMRTVVVGEGKAPLVIDEDARTDPVEVLYQYDEYVSKPKEENETAAIDRNTALKTGLELLTEEDAPRANWDACVVASDFLMGAWRNDDKQLLSFNWEKGLEELYENLGERLFAVQMTTPVQQALPVAYNYNRDGKSLPVDSGEYLAISERYEQAAAEKAARIASSLAALRHHSFNSEDTTPYSHLAEFVFGTHSGRG